MARLCSMRSRQRVLRAVVLGGAGLLGLVGAHVLDYTLLFRNPLARAGLLLQTGHSYFAHAIEFAGVSAVLAVVGSFALGFWRARSIAADRPSTIRVAFTLALIQSGGFVALEAVERLAAGSLGQRALTITMVGIGLQIAVALLAAIVLRLIERAGEIVARALTTPARPRVLATAFARPAVRAVPRFEILSRASPRAPPLAFIF
jgi:hypothetical protein